MRRELLWLKFQRTILDLTPYVLVLLALGVIYLTTRLAATTQEVKETSAYTRVSNCVVAQSAYSQLTQEQIETCYIQVEKDTGISLKRFDEQLRN